MFLHIILFTKISGKQAYEPKTWFNLKFMGHLPRKDNVRSI